MGSSRVDFSAQFGGQDAATSVLPHFKALKAASRELHLEGFPFPTLAFILRVDGEVHRYQLSGAGNLEIDKDGEYLSVDIGISHDDRDQIPDVISSALLSSVEQVKAVIEARPWNVDLTSLQKCLANLIVRYKNELKIPSRGARY
jgi:hypothetical protein